MMVGSLICSVCAMVILLTGISSQDRHCYYVQISSGISRLCFDCPVGKQGDNCDNACSNDCGTMYYTTSTDTVPQLESRFCDNDSPSCYVCPGNYRGGYGPACSSNCSSTCDENGCDGFSGNCFRCDSGYYGPMCSLLCPARCDTIAGCDQVTGDCLGCESGYHGPECSLLCESTCDSSGCDQGTGICVTCDNGWEGPKCSCNLYNNGYSCYSCNIGYYGTNCRQKCPSHCNYQGCDMSSGNCAACNTGWYGDICECTGYCDDFGCDESGTCHRCNDGYWGQQCTDMCAAPCAGNMCDRDTQVCTGGCVTGWYGDLCDTQCNSQCSEGCRETDGYCTSGCVKGWYGNQCDIQCTSRCVGGCRQTDGYCTDGCITGWYGDRCDAECTFRCAGGCRQNDAYCIGGCDPGWYGEQCTSQCTNCSGLCKQTDGSCQEGCFVGWYGDHCQLSCSLNCSSTCEQNNGYCLEGCIVGQYGDYCQYPCSVNCAGACHQFDGSCDDCRVDLYGDYCDLSCNDNCNGSTCYRNVTCVDGCDAGWAGARCDVPCDIEQCLQCDRNDETVCLQRCPDNCLTCSSVSECTQCMAGHFGPRCEDTCIDRCIYCDSKTYCNECEIGWYWDRIEIRCLSCSDNCKECQNRENCSVCRDTWEGGRCQCNVNCDGGLSMCNQETGWCTAGCSNNHYGDRCEVQCGECQSCDQTTGVCTTCIPGQYGLLCNDTCSPQCLGDDVGVSRCNMVTGECESGCVKGYMGENCSELYEPPPASASDNSLIGAMIGAVVGSIIFTLVLVFFVIFLRRRLGQTKPISRAGEADPEASSIPLPEITHAVGEHGDLPEENRYYDQLQSTSIDNEYQSIDELSNQDDNYIIPIAGLHNDINSDGVLNVGETL